MLKLYLHKNVINNLVRTLAEFPNKSKHRKLWLVYTIIVITLKSCIRAGRSGNLEYAENDCILVITLWDSKIIIFYSMCCFEPIPC